MIDVKAFLNLTTEDRILLKELCKLESEAEEAVGLISNTWNFGMRVNEIELSSQTFGLGFPNRLTHDGRWIITMSDDTEREVCIDKNSIYMLFLALFQVKNKLGDIDKELEDKAELAKYFYKFLKIARIQNYRNQQRNLPK